MRKIELIDLPTPLHEIEVDESNRYFIKRDDLTDFALGGNKARKIEYFMADILDKGSDAVVSYGTVHSNHCRIVAAAAARMGLRCILILKGDESEMTYTGNDILYGISGAEVRFCHPYDVGSTLENVMSGLRNEGNSPYFIPGGGHGNLGTQAYVDAYAEIRKQSQEMGVDFDYIFLATGTCSTQAGLIAGCELLGGTETIVGISIAWRYDRGMKTIRESLESYFREVAGQDFGGESRICFTDDYIGERYAHIYKGVTDTIKSVFRLNSIVLDPVYTGKAFHGMREYLKNKGINGKNILFIHTGGTPVFFEMGKQMVLGSE